MDSLLIQNWKVSGGKEKTGRYEEYSTDYWEVIDDMNYWNRATKKIIDREEQIKQHYNVYVYRVMPYPPNTKDKKDTVCK
jgi:endo-beta-N-acetylglucosaminidase D